MRGLRENNGLQNQLAATTSHSRIPNVNGVMANNTNNTPVLPNEDEKLIGSATGHWNNH